MRQFPGMNTEYDWLGPCPRCGKQDYSDVDCGPDGWDDDIAYTSQVCTGCKLFYDGWVDNWFEVDNWTEVEGEKPYSP